MGLHFDKTGWKPSIIQYSMGSRFLGDVTLNRTLGQMMKDLFSGRRKVGAGTEISQPVSGGRAQMLKKSLSTGQ